MAFERQIEDLHAPVVAKEAEEAARFYASIFPDSRVDRVTPLLSDSRAVRRVGEDRGLHTCWASDSRP